MSEKCTACVELDTVLERYAARFPLGFYLTPDGLKEMIKIIIQGHHTEFDRLQAENERLRDWLRRMVDVYNYECGVPTLSESFSAEAEHLLGRHAGRVVLCPLCESKSSTSAGIGTPDARVKPTVSPNPVKPEGSGKAVSVSTAGSEAPKAEAVDMPQCCPKCGFPWPFPEEHCPTQEMEGGK